jgi:NTP pyrophosphatase (non-canonical NTP hydrolase)
MTIKLKTAKEVEKHPPGTCTAAQCRQEDTTGYAPGVAFPADKGKVFLCAKHREVLEAEHTAAAVPQDAPEPALTTDSGALEREGKEAGDVLAQVKQFAIVTQEDMDFADECLGDVKAKLKTLKKMREEATKPMNEALAKVRSWFKPAETFYSEAESVWKQKMAAFLAVQAKAQHDALLAVQAAHQTGDTQKVADAMIKAVVADVALPSKVSVIARWAFRVVNPLELPEEFLKIVPDMDAISAAVAAVPTTAAPAVIPGVEVFRDDTVVRRT